MKFEIILVNETEYVYSKKVKKTPKPSGFNAMKQHRNFIQIQGDQERLDRDRLSARNDNKGLCMACISMPSDWTKNNEEN